MFLVSQTYLATDPNLPTSFLVSGLPGGDLTLNPTVAADNSVSLHFDMVSIPVGTYSITASASNIAGASAESSALSVTISPPVAIPNVPVLSTSAT